MRLIKNLALLTFLLLFATQAHAQRRYNYFSAGLGIGVSHYQGDLDDNGFDFWNAFDGEEKIGNPIVLLRPGMTAQLNYHFHPHMFVRFAFSQGWIGAKDKLSNEPTREVRNLSFRSHITEVSAQLVYEFFATQRHYRYRPNWSPYIFTGLAVFNFSPKAQPSQEWVDRFPGLFESTNEWVPLQPLGTEGQQLNDPNGAYNTPYSLTQISIPFGFGVRRKLNDRMDIRFEMGFRKTFTDYLDDVSGDIAPQDFQFANGQVRPTAAYVPLQEFYDQGQIKAALFSDRSVYNAFGTALDPDPISGERPGAWRFAGEIRGNKNNQDWYSFTTITLSYILDKPERCPKF
ncbi:MAG: DUF6089 family protein [Bacteroidetes bacterium]|nr:DUF6089 family protein [Bacteroidota bacterium]